MTEQEHDVQKQLAIHDAKFVMIMEELRQQREDMRRLWDRQDEERRKNDADMKAAQSKRDDEMKAAQAKHDADMKAAQAKHDAEMHEMNQRFYDKFDAMDKKIDANFKTLSNQIHSNFVQTMVGFGAIAAAVGGIVISAFK